MAKNVPPSAISAVSSKSFGNFIIAACGKLGGSIPAKVDMECENASMLGRSCQKAIAAKGKTRNQKTRFLFHPARARVDDGNQRDQQQDDRGGAPIVQRIDGPHQLRADAASAYGAHDHRTSNGALEFVRTVAQDVLGTQRQQAIQSYR